MILVGILVYLVAFVTIAAVSQRFSPLVGIGGLLCLLAFL